MFLSYTIGTWSTQAFHSMDWNMILNGEDIKGSVSSISVYINAVI